MFLFPVVLLTALLQKYLDNFDLSIKVIYILGTLGFSIGTAVMSIFPNVYVAMVMISSMGVISMSISYCPYALLGQYHEIKEVSGHEIPAVEGCLRVALCRVIYCRFSTIESLLHTWFHV